MRVQKITPLTCQLKQGPKQLSAVEFMNSKFLSSFICTVFLFSTVFHPNGIQKSFAQDELSSEPKVLNAKDYDSLEALADDVIAKIPDSYGAQGRTNKEARKNFRIAFFSSMALGLLLWSFGAIKKPKGAALIVIGGVGILILSVIGEAISLAYPEKGHVKFKKSPDAEARVIVKVEGLSRDETQKLMEYVFVGLVKNQLRLARSYTFEDASKLITELAFVVKNEQLSASLTALAGESLPKSSRLQVFLQNIKDLQTISTPENFQYPLDVLLATEYKNLKSDEVCYHWVFRELQKIYASSPTYTEARPKLIHLNKTIQQCINSYTPDRLRRVYRKNLRFLLRNGHDYPSTLVQWIANYLENEGYLLEVAFKENRIKRELKHIRTNIQAELESLAGLSSKSFEEVVGRLSRLSENLKSDSLVAKSDTLKILAQKIDDLVEAIVPDRMNQQISEVLYNQDLLLSQGK